MKAARPVASSEDCLINLTARKWIVQPGTACGGDAAHGSYLRAAAGHLPAISNVAFDRQAGMEGEKEKQLYRVKSRLVLIAHIAHVYLSRIW